MFFKKIISLFPIPLTKNERYDRLTKKIIHRYAHASSIMVDIGAHKGKILKMMIAANPSQKPLAFEPISELYRHLCKLYKDQAIIHNMALGNQSGKSSFIFVRSNPAYSGLKARPYDQKESTTTIEVQVEKLDNVIPKNTPISLIKIDVEGAELEVLKGALDLLQHQSPIVIFEFGKAASAYQVTYSAMFQFWNAIGYSIYTLKDFLQNRSALNIANFSVLVQKDIEYLFVAST